ncbi:dolichyl-diphosphooligosaccharide--protein glycosyltransferase 48 kDa subunit-like isoform X3 [Macadamia integrifolia]|uniref:dolichyl-diphosphooligosaccharide--protein glycosyltransferase 48 kDa subunit-like isoform X1 n=1 Tax=Macadamia integrifolia TaxID=60698 RepID=UPI001C4E7236|nr:dolichyl-diphosphooligosaccharide--protein glycosyltransferase 48 kDa subunit-like isoform X1 [Macadamia integrifolia]XP_042514320.1 dolichyl-diphosphooligosaccharide--protein glycosyltransferase 48 kDa subunit-like isoform X2 [Macadamia integrifolia]XP_042514321.1 dolichyl-diphosphooligosaccharide--protein glycosyltransferase 48 kDa subunit-like isoform X3 [Macadamia integrifolia]
MAKLLLFMTLVSLLPLLGSSFSTESPTDRRILVLLDDFGIKSSHSIFFKTLQTRGFELDFKLADDPKLTLQRYGQYLYDGLILFSPTIERFGGTLDLATVLDFVDSGRDLIVAADASASDLIRDIATECGVEFDEDPAAVVIDHTSYAVSEIEGDHTLIASDDFIQSDAILGSKIIETPVLFQGVGHTLNPANSLVLKVLSASPSAYSANLKSKLSTPPSLTGSAISLVSVVQARNNARILISGSLALFSNRFFRSGVQKAGSSIKFEKSGNEQFVTELSKWMFHERGHLKAVNIRHQKVGETGEPAIYRINDDLEYSVEIYEWSGSSWEPYMANDVQVQFYMMSPYVLKTLSTDGKGRYFTSFKVPDVYGVFQFKVEYQRLGYTSLSLSKQIPVRPFRHNEYDRFITTAFPYYGASFSTMAGFFIFSIVYLYNK